MSPDPRFTPQHRGGSGAPLVCLHGFSDTWRTWELVLPRLERAHDVLAPTLAGHAGGPPVKAPLTADFVLDQVERAMDDAGFETAHVAGNSLGGHLALRLAERGRARSVVALAPGGGWAAGDPAPQELLTMQLELARQVRAVAPHAEASVASPAGRRRATQLITERFEHIPVELLAHLTRAVAACDVEVLVEHARTYDWTLEPERIACPVRIVWGTADKLLPWPSAAERLRRDWLPHADWVVLDGVGHAPQLDVPLETAELILGVTAP